MLKVAKFGGSSMADAGQYQKVRDILLSDPARKVVVVSAAGKRDKNDHKITDLLYLCHAHLQYGVSCDAVFDMVRSRYLEIRDELGLSTPLEQEFDALRQKMDKGISADELQMMVEARLYERNQKQQKEAAAQMASAPRRTPAKCPHCGAPNDGDLTVCEYCKSEMRIL